MKVIKNNYKSHKTIMRVTKVKCCVCDSLLEIEPNDLIKHYDEFDNDWYYTVYCPCCGEEARIEGSVPIDDFANSRLYEEDYENN